MRKIKDNFCVCMPHAGWIDWKVSFTWKILCWDTFRRKAACQRKYIKILWETSSIFQNKQCLDLSKVRNGSSNRWSKAGRRSQQCHVKYMAGGLSALWCICTTPAELSVGCLTVPWVRCPTALSYLLMLLNGRPASEDWSRSSSSTHGKRNPKRDL